MGKPKQTLRNIAISLSIDPEEVLLTAWEEGFEYLTSLDSPIKSRDIKRVSALFGAPAGKQIVKKAYWQKRLGLSENELAGLLKEIGFEDNPRSIRVPRGAIAKLRQEKKKLDPGSNEAALKKVESKQVQKAVVPELEWRDDIGHEPIESEIRYLTTEEVIEIHYALAEDFAQHSDPIVPVGVKNEHLLESAVFRPQTAIGDSLKYPTIEMSAAALIHSIIHNHPFHNGNKRTALVSMLVMLDENGLIFEGQEDEVFRQVVRIAKHAIAHPHPKERDDREVKEIALWLNRNSRLIRKGEQPIPWRKLRNILVGFDCALEDRKGGKIYITRKVTTTGAFGRKRVKELNFLLHCWTDGAEIAQPTISRLRRELWLDEDNGGVDSKAFYETGVLTVDPFVRKYRKTLKRLSKM